MSYQHRFQSIGVLFFIFILTLFIQSCSNLSREFKVEKKYLNFPVKYDDTIRHLEFFVDGQKVREMQMGIQDQEKWRIPSKIGGMWV